MTKKEFEKEWRESSDRAKKVRSSDVWIMADEYTIFEGEVILYFHDYLIGEMPLKIIRVVG